MRRFNGCLLSCCLIFQCSRVGEQILFHLYSQDIQPTRRANQHSCAYSRCHHLRARQHLRRSSKQPQVMLLFFVQAPEEVERRFADLTPTDGDRRSIRHCGRSPQQLMHSYVFNMRSFEAGR